MTDPEFDVIVIGGGLAGATAARDLATEGHRVCLLEARDRLGGRVFSDTLGDTDLRVPLGGTYISVERNHFLRRELERYQIGVEAVSSYESAAHLLGGRRIETIAPIATDELLDFERAGFDVLRRSSKLDPSLTLEAQITPELNLPWSDYVEELDPAPATRDLFLSWGEAEGGRTASEISTALPFWFTAQHGNSLVAWELALGYKIQGGGEAVIAKMVEDGGFEVRLGTAVEAVTQRGDDKVDVTTAEGAGLTADAVVVAVPANLWNSIEFSPSLSDAKRCGCELRPGARGLKGSALVDGFPARFVGHATREQGGGAVLVVSDDTTHEGAQLVTYFTPLGYAPDSPAAEFDVTDRDQVQRALERFAPGCRVITCGGHDWNRDPYALGSYTSYRPEIIDHLAEMRAREGRLAFATADIARGFTIWMDGAVESGGAAAREIQAVLANPWKRRCENAN